MSRKEQELMRDIKRRWANQCNEGELFCFLCGKKIESMRQCNADHWIPKALGGKSTEENLKPAHKSCNSKKGCIPPNEFLLHRDEILANKYHPEPEQKVKKVRKKKPSNLGDTIYYIQKTSNFMSSKITVKKGVIIGYAEDDCVLVKDFYPTEQGTIESELIAVVPFSRKEALELKAKCDNQVNLIIQRQLQNTRYK